MSLVKWLYVRKEKPTKKSTWQAAASRSSDADAPPPGDGEESPYRAVNAATIKAHVQHKEEWKTVELPNREGPTQGRLYVTIMKLKEAAMLEWGYGGLKSRSELKDIKVYSNSGGKPKLPLKNDTDLVGHNKWYSMSLTLTIDDLEAAPVSPTGDSWTWEDDVQ